MVETQGLDHSISPFCSLRGSRLDRYLSREARTIVFFQAGDAHSPNCLVCLKIY